MKRRNFSQCFLLALLSGWSEIAFSTNHPGQTTNVAQSALNQQNLITNQVKNQTHETLAQEWGLTEAEWIRYEALRQGERGVWSPDLDPITVLGIEAQNDAEQAHYAKLLAKKMYERVEKEFLFQRAYDKAFAELYPGQMPFNIEPHISQGNGRVIYFTRLDNCEKCESDVNRILSHVDNKTPIDIYFVGNITDNAIQQWAKKHRIDPQKVNQRLVTLNHDTGNWLHYADGKIPSAFQVQRNGQWQRLVY